MGGMFLPATPDQIEVITAMADMDLNQDQTGWNIHPQVLIGQLRKLNLAEVKLGTTFVVPGIIPADGDFSMEFLTNSPMIFLAIEQDLLATGGGLLIKMVGTTDKSCALFPTDGGVVLDAAPTSFLAATAGLGGNLTALQALINDAMLDHVEDRCVRSGRTAGVIGGATGGGTTGGSSSGASPTVKKSSFGHVLDINLVERVVSNKEGAAAKVRVIAAFYREMTDTRRLWLSPENEFDVDRVLEKFQRQRERPMADSDPLYSISRMQTLMHLEACKEPRKFQVWLLGTQPSGDFWTSLWDFKGFERTGWGMDNSLNGRSALLEALENYAEFQNTFKDPGFRSFMAPIRALFEDPGSNVNRIHNVVLQVYLDNMLRDYGNDIAFTAGTASASIVGLTLGGVPESLALLAAHIARFVAFIKSGTVEGMPHTAFYGDPMFTRIRNKPWTTTTARTPPPVGVADRGGAQVGGAKTNKVYHVHGLCIWSLAGLMKMECKQTQSLYTCRPVPGEAAVVHTPLSKVTQATVLGLLTDTKFTGKAKEHFTTELKTKVLAEGYRFKK